MLFDLNLAPTSDEHAFQHEHLPSADDLREQLRERRREMFIEAWGQPQSAGARDWRAWDKSSRWMRISGGESGRWHDHVAGVGGGPLEFFALELLGWNEVPRGGAHFVDLLREAARWLGIDTSRPITAEERRRRAEALAAREAQRAAQAAKEAERQQHQRQRLVAALRVAARPVEGTPAAAYLRSRGITSWDDETVAYLPPLHCHGLLNPDQPALVVWSRDAGGQIVGGQRVLITADGGKAEVEARKPSFAQIGGTPARLPARIDGLPLYVAEGPETALTIWMVTGAEVWAVFGAGQFQHAPLPADRRVILCPDQDPPVGTYPEGSDDARHKESAARAFDKAVEQFRVWHPDLWIARAPEPIGSKRDLNDTLQRAGRDAVVAALSSAQPVHGPEWSAATMPAPSGTLEAARDIVRAKFQEWIDDALNFIPNWGFPIHVHVLQVGTGIGKSHAARSAAVDLTRKLRERGNIDPVVIAVPRHDLGSEYLTQLREIAGDLTTAAYRGRRADDPEVLGEKMCRRADDAAEVERAHLNVERTLCHAGEKLCPFFEECGYMRQGKVRADIWIVPHELIWRKPPKQIGAPAALIIDEDPSGSSLRGFDGHPIRISLDDVTHPLPMCGSNAVKAASDTADLSKISGQLAQVLRGLRGPIEVEQLEKAGLTSEKMREAHSLAFRAIRDADADPLTDHDTLHAELEKVAHHNRRAWRMARLFDIIAVAMDLGAETVTGLKVDMITSADGDRYEALTMRWRELVASGWMVPTVLATATARLQVIMEVWPMLRSVTTATAEMPFVHVRQITDRTFSATSVCPKAESSSPETLRHAASNRARLRRYIEVRHAQLGGRTLVIGQKALVAALRAEGLPSGVEAAHFNGLSGRDVWGDVRTLIVIGRPLPPTNVVEEMAEVMRGAQVDRISGPYPLAPAFIDMQGTGMGPPLGRRGGKGAAIAMGAERHPHWLAEALRWNVCESELMQAIGRGRGVNRTAESPLQVDILAAYPLPIAIDEAGPFVSFEPTPGDLMAARGVMLQDTSQKGAWPLVAAILPDLFPSPDGARMGFQRSREQNPHGILYGMCSSESGACRIRLVGARYGVSVLIRAVCDTEARALVSRLLPGAEMTDFLPTAETPRDSGASVVIAGGEAPQGRHVSDQKAQEISPELPDPEVVWAETLALAHKLQDERAQSVAFIGEMTRLADNIAGMMPASLTCIRDGGNIRLFVPDLRPAEHIEAAVAQHGRRVRALFSPRIERLAAMRAADRGRMATA